MKERCQVELCQKSATYGIYRGAYPEKRFCFVCGTHEHLIAIDNLKSKRETPERQTSRLPYMDTRIDYR